jgi:hypothetical protein
MRHRYFLLLALASTGCPPITPRNAFQLVEPNQTVVHSTTITPGLDYAIDPSHLEPRRPSASAI